VPKLNEMNNPLAAGGTTKPESAVRPRYARIADFCRIYGYSRSGAYRAIGLGQFRAIKVGSATLIDCDSADAFLAALPPAVIRAPRQPQQAAA
jgi:hypothetical protein